MSANVFLIVLSLYDIIICMSVKCDIHNLTAITIFFNESTYDFNEAAGYVVPVLVLSNPSSTDITVRVLTTDDSATGE